MTRAQRLSNLTSDRLYVIADGRAFVSPAAFARIVADLQSGSGIVRLPEGVTLVPDFNCPDPWPIKRAKKIVRRIHRARLKNRGKAWV